MAGMAQLLPAPLHRAALRAVHALRKRWWRVLRPRIRGCRVLALGEAGQVLLIRHSYGSGAWMPPGGGVGRCEDVIAAAIRELREETGVDLRDAGEVATVVETLHGAENQVHVVAGRASGGIAVDGREVIEAAFFGAADLPPDLARGLRDEIPQWLALYRDHSSES